LEDIYHYLAGWDGVDCYESSMLIEIAPGYDVVDNAGSGTTYPCRPGQS